MKLIFIRHAEPDYEHDSLTEKGWREAHLLADRVTKWDVQYFYCSSLGRARDTASETLSRLNRKAEILPWMQEFCVGAYNPGRQGTRVIPWDYYPDYWTHQDNFYLKDHWTEAECFDSDHLLKEYRNVTDHFDALLEKHGYRRDGRLYRVEQPNTDTLVFFCHLGSQFVVLSHLLGISPMILWHGAYVHPTSVTVLSSEEREAGAALFRIKCLGDISHLNQAGEVPSESGFFEELQPRF